MNHTESEIHFYNEKQTLTIAHCSLPYLSVLMGTSFPKGLQICPYKWIQFIFIFVRQTIVSNKYLLVKCPRSYLWCFLTCLPKLPEHEDAYTHLLHLWDFSPVCVLIWFVRPPPVNEVYSQSLHLCDFTPLCILRCSIRWPDWEEAYLHWSHL